MNVLIITRSDDNECVEQVSRALRKQGAKPFRFDSDRYPTEALLSTRLGRGGTRRVLEAGGQRLDLERVGAIWYRRFLAGGRLPEALGDTRSACLDESRRTLYGTIAATPCFQLDPLHFVRSADHKELQLRRAEQLGLDVPATLFSNDPQAVRAFGQAEKNDVITKMQHSFAIYRGGQEQVVFTNRLRGAALKALQGLEYCPMTFQEHLEKKLELRATVVGKRVFTAAVDSTVLEATRTDWRKDGDALLEAWTPYSLPKAVERALLKLTASFGLNYAAADFVVTPDGRHVFLEINAGGEFFWLARTPGLPIPQALAHTLLTPSARNVPGVLLSRKRAGRR